MKTLTHISYHTYLRKSTACFLIFCMLFVLPGRAVQAAPKNADVVAGAAGVSKAGNTTNVDVLSSRAVINWDSLDTSQAEVLQFLHDGGNFAVLNRVIKGGATQFDGSLLGHQGNIIIVNPNGIAFGPTALVKAHSFTASTLDITNDDFMNGIYKFAGDGVGEIANYGTINAEQVALIGKKVLNAGTISSPDGYTIMAAGDSVFLGTEGSDVVVEVAGVTVPDNAVDGLGDVINEGTIEATDGSIIMAAGDTYARAIEGLDELTVAVGSGTGRVGQFGTATANGSDGDGGSITLTAADRVVLGDDSMTTANAGANGDGGRIITYSPDTTVFSDNAVVEAKGGSQSGNGGFVEASGIENVAIGALVDTTAANGQYGTFLIDPTNIEISTATTNLDLTIDGFEDYDIYSNDSGSGAVHRLNYLDLRDQLNQSNVIVRTDGGDTVDMGYIWIHDIPGADGLYWSADTTLQLDADGPIWIDSPITNTTAGNGRLEAYSNGQVKGGIVVGADITVGSIFMQAGSPTIKTDAQSNLTIKDGVTVRSTAFDTDLNMDLSARERIFNRGTIVADHGDIRITADIDNLGLGYVDSEGDIRAEDGSVDITGRAVIVNTVYADDDIRLTGMSEVSTSKDFEEGGYVDAEGLLQTANGDIELAVKEFDTVYNEDWDENTYPVADRIDTKANVYVGDDIDAGRNVILHNDTKFYADADQHVTAQTGMITAERTLTKTSEAGSLYLHADQDVSLADNVVNDGVGGVSIVSDNGKIFTPGSDALNIYIRGYSDYLGDQGVDLPFGEGKAAIVLLSHDTLELGPDATLRAEGYFVSVDEAVGMGEPGTDDRPGGAMLQEDGAVIGGYERNEGVSGDIAIYIGSTSDDVIINSDSPSDIQVVNHFDEPIVFSLAPSEQIEIQQENGPHTAVIVLDAYDTVRIPLLESKTPAELEAMFSESGDLSNVRLEVISRVCEWLFQAVEGKKLPFAGNAEALLVLGDAYVMRGSGRDNPAIVAEANSNRAWVLEDPSDIPPDPENDAVPLAALELPELKGCPIEMDAAAQELAINSDQLQLLFRNSLAYNPNLQPCEACQQLLTSAAILSDTDGQRMAAMNQIFNMMAPADAPFTPEVQATITTAFANLSNEDSQYALAGEYVDAFVDYVAAVGNELRAPVGDPVAFALEKYGDAVTGAENPNIAAYIVAQASQAVGNL